MSNLVILEQVKDLLTYEEEQTAGKLGAIEAGLISAQNVLMDILDKTSRMNNEVEEMDIAIADARCVVRDWLIEIRNEAQKRYVDPIALLMAERMAGR